MKLELIQTADVTSAGGRPYSPGLRVGPWLILSGQVPIDGEGRTVGPGNPILQWRQCLMNIQALVEAAGGTMRDVVTLDIFVTDMRIYRKHGEIRKEFFEPPYPTSTAIGVTSLAQEDWFIELRATAYLGDS